MVPSSFALSETETSWLVRDPWRNVAVMVKLHVLIVVWPGPAQMINSEIAYSSFGVDMWATIGVATGWARQEP